MHKVYTPSEASALPLHDCELLSIHILPREDGNTDVAITLAGEDGGEICLRLVSCRIIEMRYLGMLSDREGFDRWHVLSSSPILRELGAEGLIGHNNISFNGGSHIQAVTNEIYVTGI
ncbi:MAG: hypothetical protein H0W72_06455 [Planctomycetes bacterium]|nr:hypothetical protein [Planctomycetota bacterium]